MSENKMQIGVLSAKAQLAMHDIAQSADAYEDFLRFHGRVFKHNAHVALEFYAQQPESQLIASRQQWESMGGRVKLGGESICFVALNGREYDLYDFSQIEGVKRPRVWSLNQKNTPEIKRLLGMANDADIITGSMNLVATRQTVIECMRKLQYPVNDVTEYNRFQNAYISAVRTIIAGRLDIGGNHFYSKPEHSLFSEFTDEQRMAFIAHAATTAKNALMQIENVCNRMNDIERMNRNERNQSNLRTVAENDTGRTAESSGRAVTGDSAGTVDQRSDEIGMQENGQGERLGNDAESSERNKDGVVSGVQEKGGSGSDVLVQAGSDLRNVQAQSDGIRAERGGRTDRELRSEMDEVYGEQSPGVGGSVNDEPQLSDNGEIGGRSGMGVQFSAGRAVRENESQTADFRGNGSVGTGEEVLYGRNSNEGESADSADEADREAYRADADTLSKISSVFGEDTEKSSPEQNPSDDSMLSDTVRSEADQYLEDRKTDRPIVNLPGGISVDLREVAYLEYESTSEDIASYTDQSEVSKNAVSFNYDAEQSVIVMSSEIEYYSEDYVSIAEAESELSKLMQPESNTEKSLMIRLHNHELVTVEEYAKQQLTVLSAEISGLENDLTQAYTAKEYEKIAYIASELREKNDRYAQLDAQMRNIKPTLSDVVDMRAIEPPKKSIQNLLNSEEASIRAFRTIVESSTGDKNAFALRTEQGTIDMAAPVQIVNMQSRDVSHVIDDMKSGELARGHFVNKDTGLSIMVGQSVVRGVVSRATADAKKHLPIEARLTSLYQAKGLIENAVWLDTAISQRGKSSSPNTMFMHKFYSVCRLDGVEYLAALTVEDSYVSSKENPNTIDGSTFTLKDIKIAPLRSGMGFQSQSSNRAGSQEEATVISVAHLCSIVKSLDEKFFENPKAPGREDREAERYAHAEYVDAHGSFDAGLEESAEIAASREVKKIADNHGITEEQAKQALNVLAHVENVESEQDSEKIHAAFAAVRSSRKFTEKQKQFISRLENYCAKHNITDDLISNALSQANFKQHYGNRKVLSSLFAGRLNALEKTLVDEIKQQIGATENNSTENQEIDMNFTMPKEDFYFGDEYQEQNLYYVLYSRIADNDPRHFERSYGGMDIDAPVDAPNGALSCCKEILEATFGDAAAKLIAKNGQFPNELSSAVDKLRVIFEQESNINSTQQDQVAENIAPTTAPVEVSDTPYFDDLTNPERSIEQREMYARSRRINVECADAIVKAISENHDGTHFDYEKALTTVTDAYSLDRIAYVVAIDTIERGKWDGRISSDNKEWATSVLQNVPDGFKTSSSDSKSSNNRSVSDIHGHLSTAHSVLFDSLVSHFKDSYYRDRTLNAANDEQQSVQQETESALHRAFADIYANYELSDRARQYLERVEKQIQINNMDSFSLKLIQNPMFARNYGSPSQVNHAIFDGKLPEIMKKVNDSLRAEQGIAVSENQAAEESATSSTISEQTFQLYQIKSGAKYHGIRYESYADNQSFGLNRDDYDLVYTGNWDQIPGNSEQEKLNGLYRIFNGDTRPDGFFGRSVSMSDVVVTPDNAAHYIDRAGFVDMPDFFEEKKQEQTDAASMEQATDESATSSTIEEQKRERAIQFCLDQGIGIEYSAENGGVTTQAELNAAEAEGRTPRYVDKDTADFWITYYSMNPETDYTAKIVQYTIEHDLSLLDYDEWDATNEALGINLEREDARTIINVLYERYDKTPMDSPEYDPTNKSIPVAFGFESLGLEGSMRTVDVQAIYAVLKKYGSVADKFEPAVYEVSTYSKDSGEDSKGNYATFEEAVKSAQSYLNDAEYEGYYEGIAILNTAEHRVEYYDGYFPRSGIFSERVYQNTEEWMRNNQDLPTVKNLSQLKKSMQIGMEIEITDHVRPECIGERRQISKIDTTGFYSHKVDDNGQQVGKDLFMSWDKAKNWSFHGSELTSHESNGSVVMSFHFVPSIERIKEQERVSLMSDASEIVDTTAVTVDPITLNFTGSPESLEKIKDQALSIGAVVTSDNATSSISIDTYENHRAELETYAHDLGLIVYGATSSTSDQAEIMEEQISDSSEKAATVGDLSAGDIIMYDGSRREVKEISNSGITLKDLDAPDYGGILLETSDVLSYDGWQAEMERKGFTILEKAEQPHLPDHLANRFLLSMPQVSLKEDSRGFLETSDFRSSVSQYYVENLGWLDNDEYERELSASGESAPDFYKRVTQICAYVVNENGDVGAVDMSKQDYNLLTEKTYAPENREAFESARSKFEERLESAEHTKPLVQYAADYHRTIDEQNTEHEEIIIFFVNDNGKRIVAQSGITSIEDANFAMRQLYEQRSRENRVEFVDPQILYARETSIEDSNIEKAEITEVKEAESSIHAGLLGNGITYYDTSRTDPSTHDYPTVAHVSPEGKIKVYDPAHLTAEDMDRINHDAEVQRAKFEADWNSLDLTTRFTRITDRATADQCGIIYRFNGTIKDKVAFFEKSLIFGDEPFPTAEEIRKAESRTPLADHILGSGNEFAVSNLDDGSRVLELPAVNLDSDGRSEVEQSSSNIRHADVNEAVLRVFENGNIEIVASGQDSDGNQCAWTMALEGEQEQKALSDWIERVTGESVHTAIDRMLKADNKEEKLLVSVLESYSEHYDRLYEQDANAFNSRPEALAAGEAFIKQESNSEIVGKLVNMNHDVFTSDRELEALAYALADHGLIEPFEKENVTFIEFRGNIKDISIELYSALHVDSFGSTVSDGNELSVVLHDDANVEDVRHLVVAAQNNGIYLNGTSVKLLESRFGENFMNPVKSVDDLKVGDRFRYKGRETIVKSLEGGIHPDDIVVSTVDRLSNGTVYSTTQNIDKFDLVRDGQYLGDALDRAKQYINDFCVQEYNTNADFSDLSRVDIAYTEHEDTNVPIQVYADLEQYRIVTEYGGEQIRAEKYDSLDSMNAELGSLDFNDLVYISDEERAAYDAQQDQESTERQALMGVEVSGEVHYFMVENLSVDEILRAAQGENPFLKLREMGEQVSEEVYAEIQQSAKFTFAVEMNLDNDSARVYVVNDGKGGIAEGDRTDSNSSIKTVKVSDYASENIEKFISSSITEEQFKEVEKYLNTSISYKTDVQNGLMWFAVAPDSRAAFADALRDAIKQVKTRENAVQYRLDQAEFIDELRETANQSATNSTSARERAVQYCLDQGTGIEYSAENGGITTQAELDAAKAANVLPRYVEKETADFWIEHALKNPETDFTAKMVQYAIEHDLSLLDYDEWEATNNALGVNLEREDARAIINILYAEYDVTPMDAPDYSESNTSIPKAFGIEDSKMKSEHIQTISDILQKYEAVASKFDVPESATSSTSEQLFADAFGIDPDGLREIRTNVIKNGHAKNLLESSISSRYSLGLIGLEEKTYDSKKAQKFFAERGEDLSVLRCRALVHNMLFDYCENGTIPDILREVKADANSQPEQERNVGENITSAVEASNQTKVNAKDNSHNNTSPSNLILQIDHKNQRAAFVQREERKTRANRLYQQFTKMFPDLVSGEHSYERYGHYDDASGFEPLSVEHLGGNTYGFMTSYIQNGDVMRDPDFTFRVDHENQRIEMLEFQMDGVPPHGTIYQRVEDKNGVPDMRLRSELETAFMENLKNAAAVGRELEIFDDKNGNRTDLTQKGFGLDSVQEEPVVEEQAESVVPDETPELREVLNEFSRKYGLGMLKVSSNSSWGFSEYDLHEVMQDGSEFYLGTLSNTGDYSVPFTSDTLRDALNSFEERVEKKGEDVSDIRRRKQEVMNHGGTSPLPKVRDDLPEIWYADSPSQRISNNMAAIRELDRLESVLNKEDRYDARANQYNSKPASDNRLRQYCGWGGLPQFFDERSKAYERQRTEIKKYISETEYSEARASTLNAHYTPQVIIDAMYKAVQNMGLSRDSRILEPSCGTGNFIARMPSSIGNGGVVGVELDGITARIANQLYGSENQVNENSRDVTIIHSGFEHTNLENNSFDLAIGNVPFGDYNLNDPDYTQDWLIHDAFFRKALDKVAPGGVVAFITSSGTLDKKNPRVREYLATNADMIGAIRLPNDAFVSTTSSNTKPTADIIFLRKREVPLQENDPKPDWCYTVPDKNGLVINSYFVNNPQMMLGTMQQTGHYDMLTCEPIPGADLGKQLDMAIKNLNARIIVQKRERAYKARVGMVEPWGKSYTYQVKDGKVYFRNGDSMEQVKCNADKVKQYDALCNLRDICRDLLEKQKSVVNDDELLTIRQKLNQAYDSYHEKYGDLSSKTVKKMFEDDADYQIVRALEKQDDKTKKVEKADIFFKRTVNASVEVTSVETVEAALQVALDKRGKPDVPYMAVLLRKEPESVYKELLDKGYIFVDPEKNLPGEPFSGVVERSEYLSGNVRKKLAIAESVAETNPEYQNNVQALQTVIPQDIKAEEISVRMGCSWIDPKDYAAFLTHLAGRTERNACCEVNFSNVSGEFEVAVKGDSLNQNETSTYGTPDMTMYELAKRILNQRRIYIEKEKEIEPGKYGKDREATARATKVALDKAKTIQKEFKKWIFDDPQRKEKYERRYNNLFNSLVGREYDGSNLTFNGIRNDFILRPHQKNCVARTIYGGNTLAAHVVGAGKSAVIFSTVMKKKELGLINKACVVVPKPLTEQVAKEWRSLYPNAKLLTVTNEDLSNEAKRKLFTARVATGAYDAVVMSQEQYEKIPMSAEYRIAYINRRLDQLEDRLRERKEANGGKKDFTVKQIEKEKRKLEVKLAKLTDPKSAAKAKDNLLEFEQLGFDYLCVDEAHYYKNGFIDTKMYNVPGVGSRASGRAEDMLMKTEYFNKELGQGHILMCTGTPISNSMMELYVMQRYLRPDLLEAAGVARFDDWAATFGNIETKNMQGADGQMKLRTVFATFANLPELMTMYKDFADIQSADKLNLPRPELKTGKPQIITAKASEEQKQYVQFLAQRAKAISEGKVEPNEDNMLKITGEARLTGLGNQAIKAMYEKMGMELPAGFVEDEESKVDKCINKVWDIYQSKNDTKGVQLIFSDVAVNSDNGNFSVYDYIKNKLKEKGIPEEEIIFAPKSDAKNREDIFAAINESKFRVVIASTGTLGTGANIQKNLVALHHIDVPWKPSDFEQREGRILRQGNQNKEVEIFNYVTEGTLDSYLYQTVTTKARFIAQTLDKDCPARVMEDCDEKVLTFGEIQAAAEGNPDFKKRIELQNDIAELKLLKSEFARETSEAVNKVHTLPTIIKERKEALNEVESDMKSANDFDNLTIRTASGQVISESKEVNEFLNHYVSQTINEVDVKPFTIGKFTVSAYVSGKDFSGETVDFKIVGDHSYFCSAGTDESSHNATRLSNFFSSTLPKYVHDMKQDVETKEMSLEQAKQRVEMKFSGEDELESKMNQLEKIEARLLGLSTETEAIFDPEEDAHPYVETKEEREKRIAEYGKGDTDDVKPYERKSNDDLLENPQIRM